MDAAEETTPQTASSTIPAPAAPLPSTEALATAEPVVVVTTAPEAAADDNAMPMLPKSSAETTETAHPAAVVTPSPAANPPCPTPAQAPPPAAAAAGMPGMFANANANPMMASLMQQQAAMMAAMGQMDPAQQQQMLQLQQQQFLMQMQMLAMMQAAQQQQQQQGAAPTAAAFNPMAAMLMGSLMPTVAAAPTPVVAAPAAQGGEATNAANAVSNSNNTTHKAGANADDDDAADDGSDDGDEDDHYDDEDADDIAEVDAGDEAMLSGPIDRSALAGAFAAHEGRVRGSNTTNKKNKPAAVEGQAAAEGEEDEVDEYADGLDDDGEAPLDAAEEMAKYEAERAARHARRAERRAQRDEMITVPNADGTTTTVPAGRVRGRDGKYHTSTLFCTYCEHHTHTIEDCRFRKQRIEQLEAKVRKEARERGEEVPPPTSTSSAAAATIDATKVIGGKRSRRSRSRSHSPSNRRGRSMSSDDSLLSSSDDEDARRARRFTPTRGLKSLPIGSLHPRVVFNSTAPHRRVEVLRERFDFLVQSTKASFVGSGAVLTEFQLGVCRDMTSRLSRLATRYPPDAKGPPSAYSSDLRHRLEEWGLAADRFMDRALALMMHIAVYGVRGVPCSGSGGRWSPSGPAQTRFFGTLVVTVRHRVYKSLTSEAHKYPRWEPLYLYWGRIWADTCVLCEVPMVAPSGRPEFTVWTGMTFAQYNDPIPTARRAAMNPNKPSGRPSVRDFNSKGTLLYPQAGARVPAKRVGGRGIGGGRGRGGGRGPLRGRSRSPPRGRGRRVEFVDDYRRDSRREDRGWGRERDREDCYPYRDGRGRRDDTPPHRRGRSRDRPSSSRFPRRH